MNAVTTPKAAGLPAMQMSEADMMNVLQNSLYPGAQESSIKLVINYCKASGLDPMQKPCHIVPMYVKGRDGGSMRDVIMPGIGLYRTQAARSGSYAGMTEPEFGEDITETLGSASITYPRWCRITIKRQMPDGAIAEFTAKEFWKENYATAGKDSAAPNAMWKRRPYAQIAKCAEAQALRKAFPEIGAAPTAEEMEGKPVSYEGDTYDNAGNLSQPAAVPKALPPYPEEKFSSQLVDWRKLIAAGKPAENIIATVSTRFTLTEAQKAEIRAPASIDGEMTEAEIAAARAREIAEAGEWKINKNSVDFV